MVTATRPGPTVNALPVTAIAPPLRCARLLINIVDVDTVRALPVSTATAPPTEAATFPWNVVRSTATAFTS